MIAIAGSKGGCGKSTVTMGLATAFARADPPTPAIAIDADRQLPNLHVVTDRDREPTLAALKRDSTLKEIAQEHPRESAVGIVPAPKPADAFEFDALADRGDLQGTQVLLDCPAGAGPDLVEPLRSADGVIVVAGDSERSLEAAETTIDVARRLGVPIYGAVMNRRSEVPDRAAEWRGVPILGCVPDRPSPLANEEVAAAFDEIVERLRAQSPRERAPPTTDGDRLPIGADALDRHLDDGLPAGSIVALVADPASQAERLLYRATELRGTLYLSTEQSRDTVRRAIETATVAAGEPTIRRVAGADALEEATTLVENLPDAATLIVDPVDELERRDRSAYVSFLDTLSERVTETGGLAILHCLDDPANRSATLRVADAVFELETVGSGLEAGVGHAVSVTKYRPDAGAIGTVPIDFDAVNAGTDPIESPSNADRGDQR
ncbi:DUF7125 family protein [Halopiger aswanensis]|uniref:MinD-like ATPase involved in chromosome partitioning or flagellar assembly n=1 Tax=Halopiger aswanensis TaxID=148449 RepID=A0A3R7E1A7_9EURY|nr:division plane positioning ATPase MipZ [Halopiger aswanensis]RKD97607.1 MinD-like ATPase involved in chromosome partitioning or flagellar assembly [Halopiger aswanensis]